MIFIFIDLLGNQLIGSKTEVKLGENSFKFQTGSPGKRKSPSDYRRCQRRRKPLEKEMPTPGNHKVGFVAPGDPTRA